MWRSKPGNGGQLHRQRRASAQPRGPPPSAEEATHTQHPAGWRSRTPDGRWAKGGPDCATPGRRAGAHARGAARPGHGYGTSARWAGRGERRSCRVDAPFDVLVLVTCAADIWRCNTGSAIDHASSHPPHSCSPAVHFFDASIRHTQRHGKVMRVASSPRPPYTFMRSTCEAPAAVQLGHPLEATTNHLAKACHTLRSGSRVCQPHARRLETKTLAPWHCFGRHTRLAAPPNGVEQAPVEH